LNLKNVVVTGVSGYIGGQTAIELHEAGYRVFGIDLMPLPKHLEPFVDQFYQTDFCSGRGLDVMSNTGIDAVVHCAGTSLVGPSKANPQEYFHNNVGKTLAMLDSIIELEKRPRVIFSSSASVYGDPVMTPCEEIDPVAPISPYGQSKLMIEWFLESYAVAYGLDFVAFRYFNAAGADAQGRHGQEPGATHIVARALESVINGTEFICNGNEYDTEDGTCVRDYVHVGDIANAHVIAVDTAVPPGTYNLGNSLGHSNLAVIKEVESVTGKAVNLKFGPVREGDPATLTANSNKFSNATGWQAKYTLTDIVAHAWDWYQID
jgi:UDP-glucose 4-epimerase